VYVTEFDTLLNSIAWQAGYITVVEDSPIVAAEYHLPVIVDQNWPTQQSHGLCDSWASCSS